MRKTLFLLPVMILLAGHVMAEGDTAAGKVKAYTCTGCHGIEGYKNTYPTYNVPRLGGQTAAYVESALKAYRAGDREHATMNLHAESLSDQDIADIAAWFASHESSESAGGEHSGPGDARRRDR